MPHGKTLELAAINPDAWQEIAAMMDAVEGEERDGTASEGVDS